MGKNLTQYPFNAAITEEEMSFTKNHHMMVVWMVLFLLVLDILYYLRRNMQIPSHLFLGHCRRKSS